MLRLFKKRAARRAIRQAELAATIRRHPAGRLIDRSNVRIVQQETK